MEQRTDRDKGEITDTLLAYDLKMADTLAIQENTRALSTILQVDQCDIDLSLRCVGDGMRKSNSKGASSTHFQHMISVAILLKHYYPHDILGRRLAVIHDAKEEAVLGNEKLYLTSDLSVLIDDMTEIEPSEHETSEIKLRIPDSFDAVYVAKYKKFIKKLHNSWEIYGSLEICDRMDGSTDFGYLLAKKYEDRRKIKALESFGRIWATVSKETENLAVKIVKDNCRKWFDVFGVTEEEVEETMSYYL